MELCNGPVTLWNKFYVLLDSLLSLYSLICSTQYMYYLAFWVSVSTTLAPSAKYYFGDGPYEYPKDTKRRTYKDANRLPFVLYCN